MNILQQAAVYLLAAALFVPLAKRTGLGSVLGYVVAGIVIGPWGLGLISDPQSVLHAAEIGVVFLLFLIGLQLQPNRLWVLRSSIFGLGTLQVAATTVVLSILARQLGYDWTQCLVMGFGLSLSSTAFALQLLAERKGLFAPYGRSAFGILLFQDLVVIPALVLLPLLGGEDSVAAHYSAIDLFRPLAVVVIFLVLLRSLLRPFLRMVAATRLQELFTIVSLLIVLISALVMQAVGLSMGLGAFLAGVLVADSEYRHQLEADIQPFKDLLLGLFFIAVGMSANVGLLQAMPLVILGLSLALMLAKATVLFAVARGSRLDNCNALQLAVYLSQGGEFGFIVFSFAAGSSILAGDVRDVLVLCITLSMVATPFLLLALKPVFASLAAPAAGAKSYDEVSVSDRAIVIAGFGRFGQVIGRILRGQRIPFTAIEIDPGNVDFVRQFGNKIYYGDAANSRLLRTSGLEKAAAFVCAVGAVEKSVAIVAMVRREFPDVRVFARARNRVHEMHLRSLGVDGVIRDTLMSSVELAGVILQKLGRSPDEVESIKTRFLEIDRTTLEKQYMHRENERMLIQTAKEAAEELERIFSADEEARSRSSRQTE